MSAHATGSQSVPHPIVRGDDGLGVDEIPLGAVTRLAGALQRSGIRYCHWKSNAQIARSESGDNDLDLLVLPEDTPAFVDVLEASAYIPVRRSAREVCGIVSFYGHDEASGRLVHVHLHDRLVLGHDRTKNYRLPIEEAYLASSACRESVLPTPELEFEYVVLVIRMVLKYCIPDEIAWNALRGNATRPKKSEREELAFLARRVDPGRVAEIVRLHLPEVGEHLFDEYEAVLDGASVARRLAAGRRLERAMRKHAYHRRSVDLALRVGRRVALAARRRLPGESPRNRLAGGGAIVALIGGDGSGKTTALEGLAGWLGSCFDIRSVHMGKPPWSATTYVARATTKALGMAARGLRVVPPLGRPASAQIDRIRPLVWFACTARDRARLYRSMERARAAGTIVLCDRYPHPLLHLMDVPQIRRITAGSDGGPLVRWLTDVEERHHARIADPDALFVLRLDPLEAAIRKTTETAESVVTRGQEVWRADWSATTAIVVDASAPAEDVLRRLREATWSKLV